MKSIEILCLFMKRTTVNRSGLAVALIIALVGFGLVQASSSAAWEWVAGPPKVDPRPWAVEASDWPVKGKSLSIKVSAPTCSGEAPPRIDHLEVTRAETRVVIRAFVRWPEPLDVSGEVKPGEPVPACADLVLTLHRTLRIGLAPERRGIYDGYFQPARHRGVQVGSSRDG